MTRKPPSILAGLSLAAMAPLLPAQQGTQQRIQPQQTERLSFVSGGAIRIDEPHGDVYLEGWDQPEVEVSVVKSMPYEYKRKHPDKASKHLDSVQVVTERKSATELTISTIHAGRKNTDAVLIEYEVHVPRDSKLTIRRAKGSVFVIGLTSDIEVKCSRGDIQLMLRDSVKPIFFPTVPERKPRRECGCQEVALSNSLVVAPPGRFSKSRMVAVLLPSRASFCALRGVFFLGTAFFPALVLADATFVRRAPAPAFLVPFVSDIVSVCSVMLSPFAVITA
jgi:hypothetical protein